MRRFQRRREVRWSLALVAWTVLVGCAGERPSQGGAVAPTSKPFADGGILPPLRVVMGASGEPGRIVDGHGQLVRLHGVNRSGTEFACLSGGFADGPVDQAGVAAMKAWHVNAVRVPLNEDCWLGLNGVPRAGGGARYRDAVALWVSLLTTNGFAVILDLHWSAPGAELASKQLPMADADHALDFWRGVAASFKSNGLVLFDLFNEPFVSDWGCWVEGGRCGAADGTVYAVAGMAALIKTVRHTGANNIVLLGGLSYSGDLSSWVSSVRKMPTLSAPLDGVSLENVAASWHAYDFNSRQSGCPSEYNAYGAEFSCNTAEATAEKAGASAVLRAGFPVVLGEVGVSVDTREGTSPLSASQVDGALTWFDGLLEWADRSGQGYFGWSWNTGTPPALVTDFEGTPSPRFGTRYRQHLERFRER